MGDYAKWMGNFATGLGDWGICAIKGAALMSDMAHGALRGCMQWFCPQNEGFKPKRMVFLGILAAFAFAPNHYWFLAVISFIALMGVGWVCSSWQQAWRCGWWWAFGWHVVTLYWIGNSLFVDAARFAWLWPLVVSGLPGILAVYTGFMMGLLVWFRINYRISLMEYGLTFALMFSLIEWIQGHAFTGFPWNLSAYMWGNSLSIAQIVSLVGSYGLGLISLLVMAMMGVMVIGKSGLDGLVSACSIGLMAVMCATAWGQHRLTQHPTQVHEHIVLRCVQPNIAQKEKINPKYAQAHWQHLLGMTHTPTHTPTHIIWPEGAFPWCMSPETLHLFPSLHNKKVLFGADYIVPSHGLYNSLLAYDPITLLHFVYAKKHLVPGGEYFPFRQGISTVLPKKWMQKITPGDMDFSPGDNTCALSAIGLPPFRCLICYESVFPATIGNPKSRSTEIQPAWILNITNDGWFGDSWGPHQHFLSARFRAIEEGLPLVRVANTGISAIIDPLGRILQRLPLGSAGVMDGHLPCALDHPTLYGRFQDTIWQIMVLLGWCVLVGQRLVRWGIKKLY